MKKLIVILWISALTSSAQKILVTPYLQPGNASTLSKEQKVVIWQTDSIPEAYKVEFGTGPSLESTTKLMTAKVTSVQLKLSHMAEKCVNVAPVPARSATLCAASGFSNR